MSKPGADPASGISLGDVLRLPKRHPACKRREAQSGSCTERENLAGDAKGKGTSGFDSACSMDVSTGTSDWTGRVSLGLGIIKEAASLSILPRNSRGLVS